MKNTGLLVWNGILTRPRQTFNWVLEKNPSQWMLLAVIFSVGIFKEVGKITSKNVGEAGPLIDLLSTILLQGGLMQVVTYTLFSWGVNFCSSWLGGEGNFKMMQIAFTWTLLLLFISGFALNVFSFSFSDAGVFITEIPTMYQRDFLLTYKWVYLVLYFVWVVWYIVLIVIGISVVQKLSIWRSICSLVLGLIIIMVPLAAITLLTHRHLWYGI